MRSRNLHRPLSRFGSPTPALCATAGSRTGCIERLRRLSRRPALFIGLVAGIATPLLSTLRTRRIVTILGCISVTAPPASGILPPILRTSARQFVAQLVGVPTLLGVFSLSICSSGCQRVVPSEWLLRRAIGMDLHELGGAAILSLSFTRTNRTGKPSLIRKTRSAWQARAIYFDHQAKARVTLYPGNR